MNEESRLSIWVFPLVLLVIVVAFVAVNILFREPLPGIVGSSLTATPNLTPRRQVDTMEMSSNYTLEATNVVVPEPPAEERTEAAISTPAPEIQSTVSAITVQVDTSTPTSIPPIRILTSTVTPSPTTPRAANPPPPSLSPTATLTRVILTDAPTVPLAPPTLLPPPTPLRPLGMEDSIVDIERQTGAVNIEWKWDHSLAKVDKNAKFSVRVHQVGAKKDCVHIQVDHEVISEHRMTCPNGRYYWQVLVVIPLVPTPVKPEDWQEISLKSEPQYFDFVLTDSGGSSRSCNPPWCP